jgi:hypothetical protein
MSDTNIVYSTELGGSYNLHEAELHEQRRKDKQLDGDFMFSPPYQNFDEFVGDTEDLDLDYDWLTHQIGEQYDEEFQVECMLATLDINKI